MLYNSYMTQEMSVTEARAGFGAVVDRVESCGEHLYLTRHGHRTAAIVPAASAELLTQVEDMLDSEAVATVLGALPKDGKNGVPFTRRTPRAH